MAVSVEWRLRDGEDALLLVDERARVVSEVSPPDEDILKSYLAVKGTIDAWRGWRAWRPVDGGGRDPEECVVLVLSPTENGGIISIDPELFWERVQRWFRSRGVDFGP